MANRRKADRTTSVTRSDADVQERAVTLLDNRLSDVLFRLPRTTLQAILDEAKCQPRRAGI